MALQLQPRQTQKQALTPAMWLGLNLLTLPVADLREAVKKEIDSNPALEVDPPHGGGGAGASGLHAADYLENVAADARETLDEHLLGELRMAGVAGRELEVCQAIVAELDEDGRFKGSLPDMIMTTGATEGEIEAARQKVMAIDPKGCGAKDLRECFLAQLGKIPSARRAEVVRAIDALSEMLAGRAAVERPPAETLALLKKLNPYPGRLFDRRKTDFVSPDIVVDEDGDVSVDQREIPELRVSPKYVEMAKDRSLDEETRRYAAERVKRAREFREAVVRRQATMEKIAALAIGGQRDFLEKGAAALRRQTMSAVAKAAQCNVATVSRAAARKWVKTPRGTFPLRRFFAAVDQGPVEKLRQMIASLGAKRRVSDRELSEMMAKAGCPMARRTVAKYRARLSAGAS